MKSPTLEEVCLSEDVFDEVTFGRAFQILHMRHFDAFLENSIHVFATIRRSLRRCRCGAAAIEWWDTAPDTFNTSAMPPGQDGDADSENLND
ncbi:MAG: hypothetical protein H8E39_00015 [Alphaproteobacteria bacterium]|nr:hypothetical protein [Alphaproteobacteria bacterium]